MTFSKATRDFVDTARGFCDWCEGPRDQMVDSHAAYWLSRLYAEALLLPKVEPENSRDSPTLPEQPLARADGNLAAFWGRYYRQVFHPGPELSDEPVLGDLGDDLTDVYRDIRAGLVLYDAGLQSDALWHWSFLHRVHRGRHAAGAVYALHCASESNIA